MTADAFDFASFEDVIAKNQLSGYIYLAVLEGILLDDSLYGRYPLIHMTVEFLDRRRHDSRCRMYRESQTMCAGRSRNVLGHLWEPLWAGFKP